MSKELTRGGFNVADFGKYLRTLREQRELGVNQLANIVKVSPSLISKVENGKRGAPKTATLDELAKVLRVSQIEVYFMAGHTSILDIEPELEFSETAYRFMTEEDLEIIKETKKKTFTFRKDVRNELKEDPPNTIGIRIEKLINEKKINRIKLAKSLDVPEYVIHNIISGDYIPDYQFVTKIANYFDVTTDYLLGRSTQAKPMYNIGKDDIDEELQDFIDNVKVWYKDEPETKEERLQMMKEMFDIIKRNK